MNSFWGGLGWAFFAVTVFWLLRRLQQFAAMKAMFDYQAQEQKKATEQAQMLNLEVTSLREQNATLKIQLEESEKRFEEQKKVFVKAQEELESRFRALASQALDRNTETFLKLASERLDKKTVEASGVFEKNVAQFQKLIEPLKSTLTKVEEDLSKVEKERTEQFGRISEQLLNVTQSSENLRKEASSLSSALRRPEVRGSWGEIQLKRVVELAGMSSYCDFEEQISVKGAESLQRPDMIVRLPNKRVLIVDAKAVLDAFLDAVQADTPEKKADCLLRHSKNLRSRVSDLSKKSYWEQFEHTPDFAVLFIPNEALLASAVEVDRELIEDALKERIVVATPTTLVALLKAVAYGWQQEQVAENAQKVMFLVKEFYDRLGPWVRYLDDLGTRIEGTVKAYNGAVGSLEGRILPAVRRVRDMALPSLEELKPLDPIDERVREVKNLVAPEDQNLL